ncbi:MAG TPA: hypothetical protein VMS08_00175 [Candidatus Saccharimonadia bacterium]|nr:hypothetical protein [Candidatus Saccharimonadia bacterium]
MDEREPSPETQVPSREQVIEALRVIASHGYTNPDDLTADDPNVTAANNMFYAWQENAARRASQSPDPAAILEHQRSASMVYVDAGFSDPDYLDEVAND